MLIWEGSYVVMISCGRVFGVFGMLGCLEWGRVIRMFVMG